MTAPAHHDYVIKNLELADWGRTEIEIADAIGHDIARVHSGDPSLYGAIAEQMRRLDELGIDYDVTPGVSAYAAAAASMKRVFTFWFNLGLTVGSGSISVVFQYFM